MTREEAIKIIDCYDIGFYDLSGEKIPADKLANAFDLAIEALSAEPNKAVPPSLADVYKWERDIALSQLEEYGIGFAEKKRDDLVSVVRCKDCRWWNSETKGCKRNPSVEAWYETDFCKYGERQCNYFGERREE